jgi:hypothetical protein
MASYLLPFSKPIATGTFLIDPRKNLGFNLEELEGTGRWRGWICRGDNSMAGRETPVSKNQRHDFAFTAGGLGFTIHLRAEP